jgi:hypothetical protein
MQQMKERLTKLEAYLFNNDNSDLSYESDSEMDSI